ncbi:MAG: hypothetical protein ACYDHA_12795, partial [Bellilinea sp.]
IFLRRQGAAKHSKFSESPLPEKFAVWEYLNELGAGAGVRGRTTLTTWQLVYPGKQLISHRTASSWWVWVRSRHVNMVE